MARAAVPVVSKTTIGQVRVDLSVVDEAGGTIGLSTEVLAVSGNADTGQMEAAREAAQEAWSAFEAETPNATPEQRRRAFDTVASSWRCSGSRGTRSTFFARIPPPGHRG